MSSGDPIIDTNGWNGVFLLSVIACYPLNCAYCHLSSVELSAKLSTLFDCQSMFSISKNNLVHFFDLYPAQDRKFF